MNGKRCVVDMNSLRYVVVDENILGIIRASHPYQVEVLVSSVIKGGPDPKNGPYPIKYDAVVRDATEEDFKAFRLSPRGYLY